jgi:hypothetical protein
MNMTRQSWIGMLVGLMIFSAPIAVRGQDDDPFVARGGEASAGADIQDVMQRRMTFSGSSNGIGTVGTFFQHLSQEFDDVNFVVLREAARLPLPELQFENLSLASIFQVLQQVTRGKIQIDTDSIQKTSDLEYPVIVVGFVETEDPPETQVVSVKELLGQIDRDTLLEAFNDGLEFLGEADAPEIRFHEKTGLLFIRGTVRQTRFLTEMVNAMSVHASSMGMGGFGGAGMMMGTPGTGMMGGPPGGHGAMMGGGGFPGGFGGGIPGTTGGAGFGGMGGPGAGGGFGGEGGGSGAGSAPKAQPSSENLRQWVTRRIQRADRSGDGVLNRGECASQKTFEADFDKMDTNGDQVLDVEEILVFLEAK